MKDKQTCGCVHDGVYWTHLCETHGKAEEATHAAWLADYRRTVRGASQAPAKPTEEDWLA